MEIRIRQDNSIYLLYPEGTINIDAAEIIETTGRLASEGHAKILCSFKKVDMVDYNGLSIITIAYKNVVNKSGVMKFCDVPIHVKELFKMARLDLVFDIYQTEEEALRAFEITSKIDKLYLRRRFERLDFRHAIQFWLRDSSKKQKYSARMLNLSGEGAFIYTKNIFPISTNIQIDIAFEDTKKHIIDGVVIWLADKDLQPHCFPGMGVQFINIPSNTQNEIVEFINKNLSSRSGM